MEFLARTYANEFDADIDVRPQPAHSDHTLGEVDNADDFTHLQKEGIIARRQAGSVNDQIDGFRDGHEVAGHVRIGDRHRAAAVNLAVKGWDHTAAASENVAKTYRGEKRFSFLLGQRMQQQFADALGRAHDVAWVYRLIR